MAELDFSTEFGMRVLDELRTEQVIWLTTVSPTGQPQPSPVWFVWRDDKALIFSEPSAPEARNIRANPKVSLAFNSDEYGNKISILQGEAILREQQMTPEDAGMFADYVEKYRGGFRIAQHDTGGHVDAVFPAHHDHAHHAAWMVVTPLV